MIGLEIKKKNTPKNFKETSMFNEFSKIEENEYSTINKKINDASNSKDDKNKQNLEENEDKEEKDDEEKDNEEKKKKEENCRIF